MSINTTLNSIVTFNCEGTGDVLFFLVDDVSANDINITNKGFTQMIDSSSSPIVGQLQATAYKDNNGSNILCSAFTLPSQSDISPVVLLLIQGI